MTNRNLKNQSTFEIVHSKRRIVCLQNHSLLTGYPIQLFSVRRERSYHESRTKSRTGDPMAISIFSTSYFGFLSLRRVGTEKDEAENLSTPSCYERIWIYPIELIHKGKSMSDKTLKNKSVVHQNVFFYYVIRIKIKTYCCE